MPTPPFDTRLDRLLAAASVVFAEKGYHGTTMRNLAEVTGMSLAGIYHYVKGKDEILFLIQTRCFEQVIAGAEQAVESGGEPADRLARFIEHHITFFAQHMAEMKVLSHESESLSPQRIAGVNALKRSYVSVLVGLIRDVQPESEIEVNVAAYALFGMMNWIYNWYDPLGAVPPRELADQFTSLFLRGLLSPTPSTVTHGG